MFQNECIGELAYESTAPAISMAAAFITFLLDLMGSRLAHRKTIGSSEAPHSHAHGHAGSDSGSGPESPALVPEKGRRGSPTGLTTDHDGCGHNFDAAFAAEQNHQVLLLEAGILFHSIMIGVTLVSSNV
jgi:zinc transporter 1/2/3